MPNHKNNTIEFKDLGLSESILKAITKLGFVKPTPIQEKSIPLLLSGDRDFIGLAQTGTGKTAAFGLPLIQNIDSSQRATQALILCPTRELAVQITEDLKQFSAFTDLKIAPVYGGVSIEEQIRALRGGAHIIVGTPGRMLDHMRRKTVKLDTIRFVVLDEADEMLNMGFEEDIAAILSQTPLDKSTWLFSATMPHEIEVIAQKYMDEPVRVTVGRRGAGAQNLEHHYTTVKSADKYGALRRFIDYYPGLFGILFCRTKSDVRDLTDKLIKDGYLVDAIHGDLSQGQRELVMKKFRNRKIRLLIATDVAARGIDVSDVTHVIHYGLPDDAESYTHRSGRTARAGKTGISLAIINPKEMGKIKALAKHVGQEMHHVPVPSGADICEKQLLHTIKLFQQIPVPEEVLEPYLKKAEQALHDVSKEELIARFLAGELNKYVLTYEKAADLNVTAQDIERERAVAPRFFINLGSLDRLTPPKLLKFIKESCDVESSAIQNITIKPRFTFFTVRNESFAEQILQGLKDQRFNQRKVRVEISEKQRRR